MSLAMVFSGFNIASATLLNDTTEKNTREQEIHNRMVDLKKEEILQALEELGEYRAKKMVDSPESDNTNSENELDNIEIDLEAKLNKLGLTQLTQKEVEEIQSQVNPQATVPGTTTATRWYSNRYSYNYNGKTHEVQEVVAQARTNNSSLSNGKNGAILYKDKQIAMANVKNVASIYAQKLIGQIPVYSWLPYELLFSDNSKVVNNAHILTYRSMASVTFSFVKLSGQNDSAQKLSYVSNMVSLNQTHTLAGINNGKGYSHSRDSSNTINAVNYASLHSAVLAFNDSSAQSISFVQDFVFYNHDKTASIKQPLETPWVPGQVY